MRKYLTTVLVAALTALAVVASLHVVPSANATLPSGSYRRTGNAPWASGATLTPTDLNNNAQEIYDVLNANIDRTNMPASVEDGIARAWASITAVCTGSAVAGTACTLAESHGITSVQSTGISGRLRVNLNYTPADAAFAVVVTRSNGEEGFCTTLAHQTAAPQFSIDCYTNTATTVDDTIAVDFIVMDAE